MRSFIVKTKEQEFQFLFEANADRFAEKLKRQRIRASISVRVSPRDETDAEYWMRHDGKDYTYPIPTGGTA